MWLARVTVAAIIEQNGKFLLVEEMVESKKMLNQPAGHLEDNETLIEAVIRETREEAAYQFSPTKLTGIYQWRHSTTKDTYMRFAFTGEVTDQNTEQELDQGIITAIWMTPEQIMTEKPRHRSPLLEACISDYLEGKRFPLSLVTNFID